MKPAFDYIDRTIKVNTNSDYGEVKKALKWVSKIFEGVFQDFFKIYKDQKPEFWLRYKNWGLDDDPDFDEVKLINRASIQFKNEVQKNADRPRNISIHKLKIGNEETAKKVD